MPNYIQRLPDHCLSAIFGHLEWWSLHSLLEAFPALKEHVILCRDPEVGTRFFHIEGLTVLDAYPSQISNVEELRGRTVLFILLEMSARDQYGNLLTTTFTALFNKVPTFLYMHSLPGETPSQLYSTNISRILRLGTVNLVARSDTFNPHMAMENVGDGSHANWCRVIEEHISRPLTIITDNCLLLGRSNVPLDFWPVERLKINIAYQQKKRIHPVFENVDFSGKLKELHIYYNGILPSIRNIRIKEPADHSIDRYPHFSLIDEDTEAYNALPDPGLSYVNLSWLDFSFLSHFQSVEMTTSALDRLYPGLKMPTLGNVRHLKVRYTHLKRWRKFTGRRFVLHLPRALTIQFESLTGENYIVPMFNAPQLKELHVRLLNPGTKTLVWPFFTKGCTPPLEVLAIHGSGRSTSRFISVPHHIRVFRTLKRLDLMDVAMDWLGLNSRTLGQPTFPNLEQLALRPIFYREPSTMNITTFGQCRRLNVVEINSSRRRTDTVLVLRFDFSILSLSLDGFAYVCVYQLYNGRVKSLWRHPRGSPMTVEYNAIQT